MVQLKPVVGDNVDVIVEFQFHDGTIKTLRCGNCPLCCVPYFNSMMVQLKQILNYTNSAYAIFQFHNGTIKTQFASDQTNHCFISIP